MVHLDPLGQLVPPDRLEQLEIRALKDSLVLKEVREIQGHQVHLELLVIQELRDS